MNDVALDVLRRNWVAHRKIRRGSEVNNSAMDATEGIGKPGELVRLVASKLARHDLDVSDPEPGRCRLSITNIEGARCELSVCEETGDVRWDWIPDGADPRQIADMATFLLTGQTQDHRGETQSVPDHLTFKGAVGLVMKARGLDVELETWTDDLHYEAGADTIVVTRPGAPEDPKVIVADDGSLTWYRDYWADHAVITWEPEYSGYLGDIGTIADDITGTRALAVAGAGTPAPGT